MLGPAAAEDTRFAPAPPPSGEEEEVVDVRLFAGAAAHWHGMADRRFLGAAAAAACYSWVSDWGTRRGCRRSHFLFYPMNGSAFDRPHCGHVLLPPLENSAGLALGSAV